MVPKMLEALIGDHHDNGGVLAYLYDEAQDGALLRDLETIDDDLEDAEVHLVKHADAGGEFAHAHGVTTGDLPALVLFADGHAAETFDGDLQRKGAAVAWVKKLLNLEEDDDDDD